MRLIDADDVVKFYKNMGRKFPELSVGLHFSINDIIDNLDNIDTVKNANSGGKTSMTKYSDIEIQTAKNLLKNGYKWIVRNRTGKLLAYHSKPSNRGKLWLSDDDDYGYSICEKSVPIFKNINFGDKEPTSLESIVHPQILDDVEKQYLKGVIKPFRNRVKYIGKSPIMHLIGDPDNYIWIKFTDGSDDMKFPVFPEDNMYKGMKTNCWYTLEELGL